MPVDDKKLVEHFILEHAPLLSRAIGKLKNQGLISSEIDEGDLREHGIIGLMKAARSFQQGGERKFHNHALDSIYKHMRQHIADSDPIHQSVRRQAKKFKADNPEDVAPVKDVTPKKEAAPQTTAAPQKETAIPKKDVAPGGATSQAKPPIKKE